MNEEGDASQQENHRRAKLEILTTERSYLEDLTTTIEVFMKPLLAQEIISKDQVHMVFNNIQVIESLNKQLLDSLEAEHSAQTSSIGQIFLDLSPYLKMYTVYVKHYSEASEFHAKLMKENSRYAQFLEDQATSNVHLVRHRSLADFLIMPIQRVPRYRMLLEELVKRTFGDDQEKAVLTSALIKVTAVARMVNESIRDHEDRKKVLLIQQRFGDQIHLIEPHRKFVLEGMLKKMCKRGPKLYEFFLFTDVLVYGTPGEDAERVTFKRLLPLHTLQVADCPEEEDADKLSFQILSPTKSFVVICADSEMKETWFHTLNMCARHWQEQQQDAEEDHPQLDPTMASKKSTTADVHFNAPVWVPDKEAHFCHMCESKFSLFLRRHHCRHCGQVVCNECSLHRFILPNLQSVRPQRICHECFLDLKERIVNAGSTSPIMLDVNCPRPGPPSSSSSSSSTHSHKHSSFIKLSHNNNNNNNTSLLAAKEEQDEEDSDMQLPPSLWKVLVDPVSQKKYYWNLQTDHVTFTRPLIGNKEEKRSTLSMRLGGGVGGFKKKQPSFDTLPIDEETTTVMSPPLPRHHMSKHSIIAGPNHIPLSAITVVGLKGDATDEEETAMPLAEKLEKLAETGMFGEMKQSRFSLKRFDALLSLSNRRLSNGPQKKNSGILKLE